MDWTSINPSTMTNDQFTEWLESHIQAMTTFTLSITDRLTKEENKYKVAMKEAFALALHQYRNMAALAPTWIPVTPETMPEVTQLIEAARAYQHTVTIMESFKSEGEYWFDAWQAAVNIAGMRLSSALKPFEK